MSHEVLYVVESSAKGPRCYVDRDAAVIDSEHYAPPAEVIEYVPRTTKPTAWQRLSAWLVAEPGRSYDRSTDGHFAEGGHGFFWFIDDESVVAMGEGPTLDDALVAALEKLK